MPLAEEVARMRSALPCSPSLASSGSDTDAGASMAWLGTLLPSGRVSSWPSWLDTAAGAAPTPARLAVQAADSRASGTIAAAFWMRPNRFVDISPLVLRLAGSPTPHSRSAVCALLDQRVVLRRGYGPDDRVVR